MFQGSSWVLVEEYIKIQNTDITGCTANISVNG
jgi:hypothetical protein